MRNLHRDYENRPISYGLNADERQRLVDLHFERARLRKLDQAIADAAALEAVAKLKAAGILK